VDKLAKEKQPTKASKAKGLTVLSEVALTEAEQMKQREESFDPIVQTPSHDEKTDDKDNDEDRHGMNVEGDEMDEEGENE
nr:hypothetical protein [Tanacetum cinerariifolium]